MISVDCRRYSYLGQHLSFVVEIRTITSRLNIMRRQICSSSCRDDEIWTSSECCHPSAHQGRRQLHTRFLATRHYIFFFFFFYVYGLVPKGLFTFLGSLYKEGAKTTYISLRETNRQKKILPSKNSVLNLECRILSQELSDSCILYFNVIFHGK